MWLIGQIAHHREDAVMKMQPSLRNVLSVHFLQDLHELQSLLSISLRKIIRMKNMWPRMWGTLVKDANLSGNDQVDVCVCVYRRVKGGINKNINLQSNVQHIQS